MECSNDACLGYLIHVLQRSGFKPEEIQRIVNTMRSEFDWVSEEEAKQIYNKSPY